MDVVTSIPDFPSDIDSWCGQWISVLQHGFFQAFLPFDDMPFPVIGSLSFPS